MNEIQQRFLEALAIARKQEKSIASFSKYCRSGFTEKIFSTSCQCWRYLAKAGIEATKESDLLAKQQAEHIDQINKAYLSEFISTL